MADNFLDYLKQQGYGNNQQNKSNDGDLLGYLKQQGYGSGAQSNSSAPSSVAQTQTVTEIPEVKQETKKGNWFTNLLDSAKSLLVKNILNNGVTTAPLGSGSLQTLDSAIKSKQKKDAVENQRVNDYQAFKATDTSPVVYSGKNGSITQAALDRWKDSDVTLSDEEKELAKEYAKYLDSEIKKDSWEHILDNGGLDYDTKTKMIQDRDLLKTKTSAARQFAYGLLNEIPGVKHGQNLLAKQVDKTLGGTDATDYINNYNKNAEGTAYTAGKVASKLGQYYTLNQSGLLKPIASKIGGWFSSRLGTGLANAAYKLGLSEKAINGALTLGETLGKSIGNITADEIADIVLDTLPEIAENVDKGMSADEVAKEALKNIGVNAAFNVGGEIVSNIPNIKQAVAAKKQGKALAQNLDDVAKQTDEVIDSVKPEKNMTLDEILGAQKSTEYRKVKLSDAQVNKNIDSIINMYAKSEDTALATELKAALNDYAKTGNPETLQRINELTAQLEEGLNGRTYLNKRATAKMAKWGGKSESVYPDAVRGSLTENVNEILDSLKPASVVTGAEDLSNSIVDSIKASGNKQALKDYNAFADAANEYSESAIKNGAQAAETEEAFNNLLTKAEAFSRSYGDDKAAMDILDAQTGYINKATKPKELADITKNGELAEGGLSKHIRSQEDVTVYTPMKMEDVSDEVVEDFINDPQMHNVLKNADTKALAEEIYNSGDKAVKIGNKVYTGDVETKFRTLLSEKNPSALPLGHQIAKDYSAAGNHEMAAQIYRDMGQALTESGQFSQAAIINMMKNDPLTAMQYAEKQLDALNREGAKQYGKKWKTLGLTDDEIKAFNEIAPGDTEAIKALYDQIGARLGKEATTSFIEKLLEGRKIAMLFNVRTNVRNFGANVPMLPLRWMSDRVEALGQNVAHLINPNFKVTQSLTGSGIQGRKLAQKVFKSDRIKTLLDGDVGKYEVPELKNALMRNRQMYKGTRVEKWLDKFTGDGINKIAKILNDANIVKNNVNVKGGIQALNSKLFKKDNVQSILETIRNTTYKFLDLGDSPFVRENFVERLGSYINAQGIKSIDDVPDEAIQLAWEEAMKATYKDDSWAVGMLRGIKKGIEKAPVIGKPLSQALIPFLQAPGNIAARMVDYSPIRGTKGIADIISGAKSQNEELVRKGIEEVSKGLTGTGLVVLGMRLKKSGIITGDYSKDKDEKNFQKQNGYRPWALHIGNKYFTYDWSQPFAQNIMIGTLVQEAIDNSDKEDQELMDYLKVPFEGAKAAVNSWFDESPLQSLSDLFKGNYGGETDIAQNLINVGVGDFAGAFVPASINAIAKTEDTTQRNYYDPSSKVNTFLNQQKAKIPELSKDLPAKYDTWGNEVKYADSKGEAFVQRFLIPGEMSTEKDDAVNQEINRLYDSTSNNKVFPLTAGNKVGDTTLNNSQVSAYQQDMGQRSRELVETFMNSDMYNALDDESKVELIAQLYGASKAIAERDVFNKAVSSNSSYKRIIQAYDNGGSDAVIDYFAKKAVIDDAGLNLSATKKIAQYLDSLGYDYNEINQWYNALGLDELSSKKYSDYTGKEANEIPKVESQTQSNSLLDYLRSQGYGK